MQLRLCTALSALLCSAVAIAQGSPGAPGQAPGRPQATPSPVILPDRRVTFSVRAPNATAVSLDGDYPLVGAFHGGRKITSLTKDESGLWSVTVGPLRPDFYAYAFTIDGVKNLDPQNNHLTRGGNWFIVPGTTSANYQINDVPHGQISQVWYPSPTLKATRRMVVYTPPGYESGSTRYPVFYLYHGGGEDELTASQLGRAPEILDNLIAQGKALPMIIVMPNWNPNQAIAPSDANTTRPVQNGAPQPGLQGGDIFQQSLIHDLIPFVDAHYRTLADKDHRAVAGSSAGGTQAILSGLQHSDTFTYVGLLSPALARVPNSEIKIPLPPDADTRRGPDLGISIDPVKFAANFPNLGPATNTRIHLLYFSVGGSEGLLEEELAGKKVFDEKGVKYMWVTRPGYGHEWSFWRQDYEDFSQLLFKPGK